MLNLHVHTQQSHMRLTGALLVYTAESSAYHHGEQNLQAMATVHSVDAIDDRPTIMPGRLVTEADLVNLAKGLEAAGGQGPLRWMDTSMLARGTDRMVWWTPPSMRPMFFAESTFNKKAFDGNGVCPVPGLVWLAKLGHGLYVYAVRGDERPTADEQLYQAPFFNVWGSGQICLGNVALPSGADREDTKAYEQILFGSRFTHPNFTQPDRLVKGADPVEFWRDMTKKPRKRFPTEMLVKVPLKAGDLLERDVLSQIAKWPKPKGEF